MNPRDPVTRDDVQGLRDDTQGLTRAVEDFASKEEVRAESGKRRRGLGIIGIVGLVLFGLVAGYLTSNRAALDKFKDQRTDSRIIACEQDNGFRMAHNRLAESTAGNDDALAAIITSVNVPNPNRTPDQQAALDAFIANAQRQIDTARTAALATRLPTRDCSPDGVDAYYTTTTKPGG